MKQQRTKLTVKGQLQLLKYHIKLFWFDRVLKERKKGWGRLFTETLYMQLW